MGQSRHFDRLQFVSAAFLSENVLSLAAPRKGVESAAGCRLATQNDFHKCTASCFKKLLGRTVIKALLVG